MIEKIIYASYAYADVEYVRKVLDILRRKGITVKTASDPAKDQNGVPLLFLSRSYESDSTCNRYLQQILQSDSFIAAIRLDNSKLNPNSEMILRRYQCLFANDFPDAGTLGRAIADALLIDKDPDIPQYEGNGKYLFISYTHTESELIRAVAEELKNRQVNIWYDRNILFGSLWSKEIAEHIAASRAFLAFVSKRFTGSLNCQAEIDLAASPDVETMVTVVRMLGATLNAGIEMYIRSGASILKYERYKDVPSLVDAILKSGGIKDCRTVPQEEKTSGFSFGNLFSRKQDKQTEPSVILIPSLYQDEPQSLAKDAPTAYEKNYRQLQQTAQMILKLYNSRSMDTGYSYLAEKTKELRERIRSGESTDDILPDAFCNVLNAYRTLSYASVTESRLISALAMYHGSLAECRESEQRILSVFLVAYTKALEGKGSHIITSLDYDSLSIADDLKSLCALLDVSLGVITMETPLKERKDQYACDITAVSYSVISLDYLRDHLKTYPDDLILRDLHYAVLAEADDIIYSLSENTSSIVGGEKASDTLYRSVEFLVRKYRKNTDYTVENGKVRLSEEGISKAEMYFKISSFRDDGNLILHNAIINAVKAHELYVRGIHYLIQDSALFKINPDTGIADRYVKYPNGLRHALEAKEGLMISEDNKETAQISARDFLNMYACKAGIVRLAINKQNNLEKQWGWTVISIPSSKPSLRKDLPSRLYAGSDAKISAIVDDAIAAAQKERAVIIGAPSAEDFKALSAVLLSRLNNQKLPVHLNLISPALDHQTVKQFIRTAGNSGYITLLLGNYTRGIDIQPTRTCISAGGLFIIASSYFRNEAMEEQLRSISGRFNEPGETVTYLSLEDPQIKPFIPEKQIELFDSLDVTQIDNKLLIKAIQKIRQNTQQAELSNQSVIASYNDVFSVQRKQLYRDRERILHKDLIDELFVNLLRSYVTDALSNISRLPSDQNELDQLLRESFPFLWNKEISLKYDTLSSGMTDQIFTDTVAAHMEKIYRNKALSFDDNLVSSTGSRSTDLLRAIMLKTVDKNWESHILALDKLRSTEKSYNELREYLPLYQENAAELYSNMISQITEEIIYSFFNITLINRNPDRSSPSAGSDELLRKPAVRAKKIGRNDPCPCGSGKKYKNCHGRPEQTDSEF